MRDKWNFRAEVLSKITLDQYVNRPDRFPIKKKTRGMPETDLSLISNRIGRRVKRIMYLSTAV